ncbi:MAG: hypothetical protein COA86_01050 [Kangiella sp.]|nr:MAG: hypothetical protein COA86_01050 [Kangiella sp.]
MKSNLPIPQDKKLLVIYRLEPECLGTIGHKQINYFCAHITKRILPVDSDFVKWTVLPRLAATEKEVEFRLNGKLLQLPQVVRYLTVFNRDYDAFLDSINNAVLKQVDHYFN